MSGELGATICFRSVGVPFAGVAVIEDHKKPIPLVARENKPRRLCSVCGTVTYSFGGIHPQCAQKQADASRVAGFKAAKKAESPKEQRASTDQLSPWQKVCPKCQTFLHVRNLTCDCGHRFSPVGWRRG
jgi:hypothetical protein